VKRGNFRGNIHLRRRNNRLKVKRNIATRFRWRKNVDDSSELTETQERENSEDDEKAPEQSGQGVRVQFDLA